MKKLLLLLSLLFLSSSVFGGVTGPNGGRLDQETITCTSANAPGIGLLSAQASSPYQYYAQGKIVSATIIGSEYQGNPCYIYYVDILKNNNTIPSSSITGGNPLALFYQYISTSNLVGWNTTVNQGDVFTCYYDGDYDSCDSFTVELEVQK